MASPISCSSGIVRCHRSTPSRAANPATRYGRDDRIQHRAVYHGVRFSGGRQGQSVGGSAIVVCISGVLVRALPQRSVTIKILRIPRASLIGDTMRIAGARSGPPYRLDRTEHPVFIVTAAFALSLLQIAGRCPMRRMPAH